ncbi:MAG TPA: hypothetical protein PKL54_15245, partial [Candidatus Hydrogenedentes bacterium]|nr:hypothetical protein [Candidatus Hydrogenedentota bacterium]
MHRIPLSRRFLAAILCAAVLLPLPARAHPYLHSDYWADFQSLLGDLPTQLDALLTTYVGCPLWSTDCNSQTAIWSQVAGQQGPAWIGANHGSGGSPSWAYTGAGIPEQDRFALLESVVNPAACVDGLSPAAVSAVRGTFAANRAVMMPEIAVGNVRLTGTVNYVISLNLDETVTIVTGARNTLCVDTGIPFVGTTCLDVDVPPLEQLLDDANERLDDGLRNMT